MIGQIQTEVVEILERVEVVGGGGVRTGSRQLLFSPGQQKIAIQRRHQTVAAAAVVVVTAGQVVMLLLLEKMLVAVMQRRRRETGKLSTGSQTRKPQTGE